MSALPNFQYGDDFYRVAPPDLIDAPTVMRRQAVESVIALLTHETESAFGWNRDDWNEWMNDLLARSQDEMHLILLDPTTVPSLPTYMRNTLMLAIERKANELLAEMDAEQIERQELSQ